MRSDDNGLARDNVPPAERAGRWAGAIKENYDQLPLEVRVRTGESMHIIGCINGWHERGRGEWGGGVVVVLDCGNVGQTCDAGGGRLVCLYWADIMQYIISEQAIKCIKCPPTHSNRPNVGLQRGREACSGCHIKSVIDKPEQNDI